MNSADIREVTKVLLISTSYPLRHGSACGVFVARLAEALTSFCDITVVCPDDNSPAPPATGVNPRLVPFRYAPRQWQKLGQSPGGVFGAASSSPILWCLLPTYILSFAISVISSSRRAHVIHANWAICGAIALILRPLHGKPVIVTLRGDDVTLGKRSLLHALILKIVLRFSSRVICVSASMAKELEARDSKISGRLEVILNGIDAAFFRVGEIRQQRTFSRGITLLFVGSLIGRKGVLTLIDAFALCRQPGAVLRIIGDGPLKGAVMERIRSLGLRERVEVIGELAPDGVPEALLSADGLVLPSVSEGRPNVMLEGIAARLPIIATNIPGVAETISDPESCWLVPVDDPISLASAMDDLMRDSAEGRRRADAALAKLVQNGHSWEACAERYYHTFRACVQG